MTTQTDAAPNKLTRVIQIALWVNAVLHLMGTLGMLFGIDPHGAAEPIMARRAAAAGVAAFVMFAFVSKRIARDPALIALPWTFVLGNFTATLFQFASGHDPHDLAPALPEATFLTLYSIFALRVRSTQPG
jgi:hypothetical protein